VPDKTENWFHDTGNCVFWITVAKIQAPRAAKLFPRLPYGRIPETELGDGPTVAADMAFSGSCGKLTEHRARRIEVNSKTSDRSPGHD